MPTALPSIAIIGSGPAGLMAAERLSAAGLSVDIYERMPSVGRKFLMAGRGGLNLTHSEGFESFADRYGPQAERLRPLLEAFGPKDLQAWADGLGAETFVGSSGRVFPKVLKASPLLRAWLRRLETQGVRLHLRHDWQGFDAAGGLVFATPDGPKTVTPLATLLTLGGASWPRLGADGGWQAILAAKGVAMTPFTPANMGFNIDWSAHIRDRFAGTPIKNIALRHGDKSVRGEIMITRTGVEGGAIYALSADLRDSIAQNGRTELILDLKPDLSLEAIQKRLQATDKKQSLATRIRKTFNLTSAATALLNETQDGLDLAHKIKNLRLSLTGYQGLERAISSGGGVSFDAVDNGLQLKALPSVYAAGEMLDWEAPTGGYLLQACFSTAVWAANAILKAHS